MSGSDKINMTNLLEDDHFIIWVKSDFKIDNQYWVDYKANLNSQDVITFDNSIQVLVKLNTLNESDVTSQKSPEFINKEFQKLIKASEVKVFKLSNLLKYAAAIVLLIGITSVLLSSGKSPYSFSENLAETNFNNQDILIKTPENKYYNLNANIDKQWNINENISVEITNGKINFISTNDGVSTDNQNFKIIVPENKHYQLNLIDGTEIDLKSNTTITFNNSTISKKRKVNLVGEAIFNVAHNKSRPFIVQSSDMKIEALGTIFNVSNYSENNYTSTTLIDGSIKVSNPQGENETIKPGYQVKFFHNQNRLIINNVKEEKKVSSNFIQKSNNTNLLYTNNKETLKTQTTI